MQCLKYLFGLLLGCFSLSANAFEIEYVRPGAESAQVLQSSEILHTTPEFVFYIRGASQSITLGSTHGRIVEIEKNKSYKLIDVGANEATLTVRESQNPPVLKTYKLQFVKPMSVSLLGVNRNKNANSKSGITEFVYPGSVITLSVLDGSKQFEIYSLTSTTSDVPVLNRTFAVPTDFLAPRLDNNFFGDQKREIVFIVKDKVLGTELKKIVTVVPELKVFSYYDQAKYDAESNRYIVYYPDQIHFGAQGGYGPYLFKLFGSNGGAKITPQGVYSPGVVGSLNIIEVIDDLGLNQKINVITYEKDSKVRYRPDSVILAKDYPISPIQVEWSQSVLGKYQDTRQCLPQGLSLHSSLGTIRGTPRSNLDRACHIDHKGRYSDQMTALPITFYVRPALPAQKIASAFQSYCVITEQQEVKCWGMNLPWNTKSQPYPKIIEGLPKGVSEISGGSGHYCVLSDDPIHYGEVWCWGNNLNSQLGNSKFDGLKPQPHPDFGADCQPKIIQLALGGFSSCGLSDEEGQFQVYCWGAHGSSSELTQTVKFKGQSLKGVEMIAAKAGHACALKAGKLYCWGSNQYGQLGTAVPVGSYTVDSTAVELSGFPPLRYVSLGDRFTCGIAKDTDEVWCVGDGERGQLGYGGIQSKTIPQRVLAPEGYSGYLTVKENRLWAGIDHSCAVAKNLKPHSNSDKGADWEEFYNDSNQVCCHEVPWGNVRRMQYSDCTSDQKRLITRKPITKEFCAPVCCQLVCGGIVRSSSERPLQDCQGASDGIITYDGLSCEKKVAGLESCRLPEKESGDDLLNQLNDQSVGVGASTAAQGGFDYTKNPNSPYHASGFRLTSGPGGDIMVPDILLESPKLGSVNASEEFVCWGYDNFHGHGYTDTINLGNGNKFLGQHTHIDPRPIVVREVGDTGPSFGPTTAAAVGFQSVCALTPAEKSVDGKPVVACSGWNVGHQVGMIGEYEHPNLPAMNIVPDLYYMARQKNFPEKVQRDGCGFKKFSALFTLDLSGSMNSTDIGGRRYRESRLDLLKNAVNTFIDQSPHLESEIAVTGFNTKAVAEFNPEIYVTCQTSGFLDASQGQEIKSVVNNLSAFGGTPIYDAFLVGKCSSASVISKSRYGSNKAGKSFVVFVTDGEPTGNADQVNLTKIENDVVETFKNLDTTVYTIIVDVNSNKTGYLRNISKRVKDNYGNNGCSFNVVTGEQIQGVITKIINHIDKGGSCPE